MTIQKAIELAVKNGYQDLKGEKTLFHDGILFSDFANFRMTQEEIFLDKDFWIALSKSLKLSRDCICSACNRAVMFGGQPLHLVGGNWVECWHSFIDALAEGKSPESWFEQLN